MLSLPNDHRAKIVCESCGEVLRRKPMQSVGEALLVWMVVLGAALPVAILGGNIGIGLTLCLIVLLGWMAPWQGLTYELSTAEDEVREQLPAAKLVALPPKPSDPGGGPPNPPDAVG